MDSTFERLIKLSREVNIEGDEADEGPVSKGKFWSSDKEGNYLCFYPELNPREHLPPGCYRVGQGPMGMIFQKDHIKRIETVDLSEEQRLVLSQVEKFWGYRDRYMKLGIPHKRGYLLHGKPGTGKTTILTEVVHRVIEMGGVAINLPNSTSFEAVGVAMRDIHKLDGPRPICLYAEDVDVYEDNNEFVNFLDGTSELDGVIVIGTTNYIDEIPDRLKDRPGRFDEVHEVVPPEGGERAKLINFYTRALREEYGEDYGKEIMKFADSMDRDKTPAEIRGAIVDRYIFGEEG